MKTRALEAFGLTDKEVRVYLAALELGETNIERISNKSKIKRTTVYDVIKSLAEKGLIGTTFKKSIKSRALNSLKGRRESNRFSMIF